ncbi:hypothetical protein MTO96_036862 [Rhipicephalus appendiculatus]
MVMLMHGPGAGDWLAGSSSTRASSEAAHRSEEVLCPAGAVEEEEVLPSPSRRCLLDAKRRPAPRERMTPGGAKGKALQARGISDAKRQSAC